MFVEDKPVITNTPTKTGVGAGKILGVERFLPKFKTEVPNLGYMYPRGYICLSEGIQLG